jgi:YceI-like domain
MTIFDVETLNKYLFYMKKIFTLFCLSFLMGFNANAQRAFETKNAIVRFVAVDDNDIDAVNREATSRLEANGVLTFNMLAKGFHFGIKKMEEHFNSEYIESHKFPRVTFSGQITNFNTVNFAKNGKYPVTVTGTMQVHGKNKAIQTNGTIEIVNGIPKATAQFTVRLKDFGMDGVLISFVADKVNVEVTANY